MKKLVSLFLCLVMVFALAACGKQKTPSTPDGNNNTDGEKKPTYVIQYSHVQSESTPTHRAMLWLKDYLEEQTDGDMTMEIYPAGQLYNDSTEVDAIIAGNIDMTSTNIPKLTSLDPDLEYAVAPYLFDNTRQMLAFYNSDACAPVFTKLNDVGITVLGGYYNGYHLYFSTKKVIDTPESWKGLNCRDSGGNMVKDMYKATGTSMVSISYGDLYTGMDSGMADMVNTSIDGVTGIALQDILSYGIDLDQQQCVYLVQVNTNFFNSLPTEYQEILREGVHKAADYEFEICESERDTEIAKIEAAGCTVVNATEEQKDAFKAVWQPVVDQYITDTWKNTVAEFKANYKG